MRNIPALLVGAVALVLTGCTAGSPTPVPTPNSTDAGGSGAPSGDLATCLDGDWELDVQHLVDQFDPAVDVPGVPVDDFSVDGGGELSFDIRDDDDDDDREDLDGDIDLRVTGSLEDGARFAVPIDAEFEAYWAVGDEPDTITIEQWRYDADDDSQLDGVPLPRPMDFSDSSSIRADCSGDELLLSTGSTRSEVRWIRDDR